MRHKVSQLRPKHRSKEGTSGNPVVASPRRDPIRVVIAATYEIARAGVRASLADEQDLAVIGEAARAADVLPKSQRARPDVILLESRLASGSEAEICRMLFAAFPLIQIIIVGRDNSAAAFGAMLKTGAQGFLTESVSPAELIEAIRTVAKGRPYLGCESTQEALRLLRQQQNGVRVCSGSERLSLQERRIIELMAGGNTNKEIAVKLALSDKAVKNYINKIFVKLEVDRRTEAVARYLQTWQPSLLPDRSMSA